MVMTLSMRSLGNHRWDSGCLFKGMEKSCQLAFDRTGDTAGSSARSAVLISLSTRADWLI